MREVEITVRHHIFAEVLKNVGAQVDHVHLVLIASALLDRMEPLRQGTPVRRHKISPPQVWKGLYPWAKNGITSCGSLHKKPHEY